MKTTFLNLACWVLFSFLFLPSAAVAQTDTAKVEEDSVTVQKDQPKEKKKSKFGSLLGKAVEVSTGLNVTNEPFIVNPLSGDFAVEFVSCQGNPSDGRVSLTFKVKSYINETGATFGGSTSGNGESLAFAADGKNYKPYSSAGESVGVAKGTWVEVTLDAKNSFYNVPTELKMFEVIKLSFSFNAKTRGLLEFRNIPINWGAAIQ